MDGRGWQRVSPSWLGLERVLLEVSLLPASRRELGMDWGGARFFQTLGPMEGRQARPQQTAPPSQRSEMPS